jgi:hypothetical protein
VALLQRQLRYKALSDIIVGGSLLFPKGQTFLIGEQFGTALVKEGRAELLAALEQPRNTELEVASNKGRHKRRDMRAKDPE